MDRGWWERGRRSQAASSDRLTRRALRGRRKLVDHDARRQLHRDAVPVHRHLLHVVPGCFEGARGARFWGTCRASPVRAGRSFSQQSRPRPSPAARPAGCSRERPLSRLARAAPALDADLLLRDEVLDDDVSHSVAVGIPAHVAQSSRCGARGVNSDRSGVEPGLWRARLPMNPARRPFPARLPPSLPMPHPRLSP
jgi:hypothetical protein